MKKSNDPDHPDKHKPPPEAIPWMDWARECQFQPGSLAELLGVPLEQIDACWMILFRQPAVDWLPHLRACEMVRLLCEGHTVAAAASELGFPGETEFANFCLSFLDCDPASLIKAVCQIEQRERRPIELIFGEGKIPDCWAAALLCKSDALPLCAPNWAWPAGQRRRIPGRNLLANLLHPHLAAGDAKAPDAVCALLRDSILKHLSGQFPQADEHAISDAFTTAFLDYLERPNSFDPACGELEAFLKQAARCDLRDLDRAARRRGQVELAWQKASYGPAPALLNGKPLALPDAGESPAEQVEKKEAAENLEKFLRKFIRQLDKQERIVFELQRHRRRKTALFAAALGIVHLPKTRQAREVKKIKDRLRFKLQTLLKKLEQNS